MRRPYMLPTSYIFFHLVSVFMRVSGGYAVVALLCLLLLSLVHDLYIKIMLGITIVLMQALMALQCLQNVK